MNVAVSVFGRFHAFDLARELNREGALAALITSYPAFEVTKHGVPPSRVRALPVFEILRRGWGRVPGALRSRLGADHWIGEAFDRAAARRLPDDLDVFVGWSGTAERGLVRARELGALAVVERGSSHIASQRELLRAEYERHGLPPSLPDPAIVEKETREYELADLIAVPSTFAERTFLDHGIPRRKLARIPYGVDPEVFRPHSRRDARFRVVYAGSLCLRKGTPHLLRAFAELRLPDAELWLLGTHAPEIRPWLRRYRDSCWCPGHVPQDRLPSLYSQGSVFVLPSIEDGFGCVLLQAMSCGLPLICTPSTGGPDAICEGREGFVVPVGDVEALQERLSWLYEHPEAGRAMGTAARHRIHERFTWKHYGQGAMGAYSEHRSALAGEMS